MITSCQFLTFLESLFCWFFIVKIPIQLLVKILILNFKCKKLKMNSFLPKSKVDLPSMLRLENRLNLSMVNI